MQCISDFRRTGCLIWSNVAIHQIEARENRVEDDGYDHNEGIEEREAEG